MSDWDTPDTSDFFTIKDHVGDLVIIAVNEFTPDFVTAMGVRDTIKAEIAIVDGNEADTRYAEALLFGSRVVPQLRGKIGAVVLGRIARGTAKPGQSAPYLIEKPTQHDKELATKWVKVNGEVNAKAPAITGNTTTTVSAAFDDDEDAPF